MRGPILLNVLAFTAAIGAQAPNPAATGSSDLLVRVGLTAEEASTARSGRPVVRLVSTGVATEVAAAGAIRIQGDLERLVLWLTDIAAFRTAIGTEAVGVFSRPARPEDFGPAAVAAGLDRQRLAEYASAYQSGGDAALGALRDRNAPDAIATEFQDMLRRATTLWNLAYPFASYLETFPAGRPPDVDERFYWTHETAGRQPVTTLHHVVLQRLSDKSLRLADKQFYASRDLDTALLVGQATPIAGGKEFDLVLTVRGRSARLGSVAARVLRGRIERETTETLGMYLEWLRKTFALG